MAAGYPVKANYATGDVLTAANMNDLSATVNYAVSTTPTTATQMAGKNKIINGDFGIWARGTTFTGITSGTFTADRFDSVLTTSTCNVSQQTFTAGTAPVSGYEANYFIRHVVTTGGTAGSRYLFQQKIEDVRTFAGQTITLSFWAKADSAKNISPEAIQFFGSGGSTAVTIATSKQAITTSWARYNFTIAIPSISGKTLGANNYLSIAFWLDAGSDFNARTNSLGNQSGTFDFWGIQVEAGSVATSFQTATGTIQGELAACQRYYWRDNLPTNMVSYQADSQTIGGTFPSTMRTSPTMTTAMTNGNYGTLWQFVQKGRAASVKTGTLTFNFQTTAFSYSLTFDGATFTNPPTSLENLTTNYIDASAEL